MTRIPTMLFVVTFCILGIGCQEPVTATAWFEKTQAPGGGWLAVARNQQWIGPGMVLHGVAVYLEWMNETHPSEILVFSRPYAEMQLKMEWVTPTHLNVIYAPLKSSGQVTIAYQVVKFSDIDISVHGVTTEEFNNIR